MFERSLPDPSADAVRRLVGLFKLGACGQVLNGLLFVVAAGLARPLASGVTKGLSVLLVVFTWATADGIDGQKRWARNAGLVIAFLSLLNLPVGTVFGLVELYSLWRAQRGGQFKPGDTAA